MEPRPSRFVALLSSAFLFFAIGAGPAAPPHAATFRVDAVASDHAEASRIGASVLAAGGTAADAAAATMLALGVASPGSSGLGGGGFALYYRASDRSLTFLDFRETAPAASTADMFEGRAKLTPLDNDRYPVEWTSIRTLLANRPAEAMPAKA